MTAPIATFRVYVEPDDRTPAFLLEEGWEPRCVVAVYSWGGRFRPDYDVHPITGDDYDYADELVRQAELEVEHRSDRHAREMDEVRRAGEAA